MKITDIYCVSDFIRTCNDGWLIGYHERNGGNLTYRMTQEDVEKCRPFFKATPGEWVTMGVGDASMAGEYFIATGSGKYFRNVLDYPQDNICIVEINDTGDSWRIVWGLEAGGRPTSEFPTHFMNHAVRKRVTNGAHRVIYHAHTPAIIALTYVLPLEARAFSRVLWQSATECPVVFPSGVAVVPWMVPGGSEIALATCKEMESFDVAVWAHHGTFCSADTCLNVFGLMHTVEKAADIYIRALSTGLPIRQTITDDNLRAIARDFGVQLKDEFLD